MSVHSFPDTPLRADSLLDRGAHLASRLGGMSLFVISLFGLVYLAIG